MYELVRSQFSTALCAASRQQFRVIDIAAVGRQWVSSGGAEDLSIAACREVTGWRSGGGGQPSDNDVADHSAQVGAVGRLGQIEIEEVAEGVLVGHLEHAVRADHEMDVEGADVGTKQPGGPTVVEDLVEQ